MNYQQPNYSPSPPQSLPHSTEIEHRLTVVEEDGKHIKERMSLHERAILALASGLYIVAQERFPQIAQILRGILQP